MKKKLILEPGRIKDYRIVRIHNSVDYNPGQELQQSEVKSLIEEKWEVVVQPRKK